MHRQSLVGKRIQGKSSVSYIIDKSLGSGSAAIVFAGHVESDPNFQVAIKVIDLTRFRLSSFEEREKIKLRREIDILRRMDHPGVVKLYEVIEENDENIFMVMELINGGELFYRIVENGKLDESYSKEIFSQLLGILEHLHENGVIHRDLKPENILLTANNNRIVKLVDFGLSKHFLGDSKARTFVGTPQYWAPEVVKTGTSMSGDYGPEADLWSLGCVLYVMLSGTYPIDEKNVKWSEVIALGGLQLSPSKHPRIQHCSPAARDLITKLLTVDPRKRISVLEAKEHPWLKDYLTREPSTIPVIISKDSSPHLQQSPDNESKGKEIIPRQEKSIFDLLKDSKAFEGPMNSDQPPETIESRRRRGVSGVFKLDDLLRLQISLIRTFHIGFLAFRNNPKLASSLKNGVVRCRELQARTGWTVNLYSETCKSILTVLPDVCLAIQEGLPDTAMGLLDDVRIWVKEMKEQAQKTYELFFAFEEFLHKLIEQLTLAKKEIDETLRRRLHTPDPTQFIDPRSLPSPHPKGCRFKKLRESLMQRLEDVVSDTVVDQTADPSMVAQEVLDFLFIAPVVDNEVFGKEKQLYSTDTRGNYCQTQEANSEDFSSERSPPTQQRSESSQSESKVTEDAGTIDLQDTSEWQSTNLFMRALDGMRSVDHILHKCVTFWSNIDLTIGGLIQLKDHTTKVVHAASVNRVFAQRFKSRIDEYMKFWSDLQRVCSQYVEHLSEQMDKMSLLVQEIESTADHVDTAMSLSGISVFVNEK
eukprot:GHVP01061752.1.p1 GENE.GHVP01061752.1~~GHVP01061752.1.p1  ORF type:complete len:760 (+),score=131.09 GHVP01061752.1:11-2290(+)